MKIDSFCRGVETWKKGPALVISLLMVFSLRPRLRLASVRGTKASKETSQI